MHIKYKNLTVRDAEDFDAEQLTAWWNDGAVMAHAGFPNGLGTNVEKVIAGLHNGRLILEENERRIGEASYRTVGEGVADTVGAGVAVSPNFSVEPMRSVG